MPVIRPVSRLPMWSSLTSNESVLNYCMERIAQYNGSPPKVIGICGASGSGISALLYQVDQRARKLCKRVLHVKRGRFPDGQDFRRTMLCCLGIDTVNVPERIGGLLPLCTAVLELRRYDVLLIEDAQKYNRSSRGVTEFNRQALLQITRLPQPPLIIMAGLTDGVKSHHANFVGAGVASVLSPVPAMANDQNYAQFTHAICRELSSGDQFLTQIDVDDVYQKSQGRVGQTVRLLEWLFLKAAADVSFSKHEAYQQIIPIVFDEDGEYADEDTELEY